MDHVMHREEYLYNSNVNIEVFISTSHVKRGNKVCVERKTKGGIDNGIGGLYF